MGFIITIKVIPSSGKSYFFKDKNGLIKCFLKQPPKKGLANKELIKLLSKNLAIPKNIIEIIAGLTSTTKKIKIHTNISETDIYKLLHIPFQQAI